MNVQQSKLPNCGKATFNLKALPFNLDILECMETDTALNTTGLEKKFTVEHYQTSPDKFELDCWKLCLDSQETCLAYSSTPEDCTLIHKDRHNVIDIHGLPRLPSKDSSIGFTKCAGTD